MAQRTTKQKVQAKLEAGVDYDLVRRPDLQPFIDAAVVLTDAVAACASAKSYTWPAGADFTLELIERALACWSYKNSDQQHASRSTGGSSGSFKGTSAMHLDSNHYGQEAKTLDTSGCLITLVPGPDGKRPKARAFWAGRRPSEQAAYRDRD
jgi:hypothetical protein